ncbi:unnamed protein product [Cylindrotheca closterium]|uniref:Uncharacterized protein n=1 Tax=Cylindrotheca closterium TaxID=2856 RepID=A0AAD2G1W2_9STRA|nr:unnamed protein product [Cylindrotheca closterium]
MLLELKHGYVSRSATQSVTITSPEYIAAKASNGANSSAADLIQWLRTQAGNPEVNLHYTVLSYEMTPTNGDLVQGTISNPKGRRSKTNPLPNTKTVMRNLTYSNTIRSLAATRQAVHAATAPMIKQQFGRFTSTLTVKDQLTRTEFIHNQREAIEAKAIKAVCSKFVRAKAMPGGVGDTTKNASEAIRPHLTVWSSCSLW